MLTLSVIFNILTRHGFLRDSGDMVSINARGELAATAWITRTSVSVPFGGYRIGDRITLADGLQATITDVGPDGVYTAQLDGVMPESVMGTVSQTVPRPCVPTPIPRDHRVVQELAIIYRDCEDWSLGAIGGSDVVKRDPDSAVDFANEVLFLSRARYVAHRDTLLQRLRASVATYSTPSPLPDGDARYKGCQGRALRAGTLCESRKVRCVAHRHGLLSIAPRRESVWSVARSNHCHRIPWHGYSLAIHRNTSAR